jgi:hypothetical protein
VRVCFLGQLHPAAAFLQELNLLKFNKEGKMEKQENYGRHDSVHTTEQISDYTKIPTKYIEVDGIRSLGKPSDVPIVCLQHFIGTLDNWDPLIMNDLAAEREVITIKRSFVT